MTRAPTRLPGRPRTPRDPGYVVRSSPWAFRDLPFPARLWWWMFLGLGCYAAPSGITQTGTRDQVAAIGWGLLVAGVFTARRNLPGGVAEVLVLAGNALILLSMTVPILNLIHSLAAGQVVL